MQTVANDIKESADIVAEQAQITGFTFQLVDKIADMQISITKRITPFRNAVTFIYNNHEKYLNAA